MSKSVVALAFVLALPALPAAAQFSPGEYQEHPVVKLYPGAAVDLHDDKPFDVAQIATDIKGGALVLGPVGGRVTRYTYLHGPGVSALQVLRNFEAALAKEGFRTLTVAQVSTLPQLQDQHLSRAYFGAFRLDRGGAPALYVNIAVDPNGDEPRSDLVIVQPAAMQQDYAVDARSLRKGLEATGRVAVYGVNFDTGKTTIRPESSAVLSQVRDLLAADPSLKLKIEGHTDNVGKPPANKALSEGRAGAVKAWLEANGVAAGRLTIEGLGDTRPVASTTATRAGRRTAGSNWSRRPRELPR